MKTKKPKKKLTIEEEKKYRQQMNHVMLIGITLDAILQVYPLLMENLGNTTAALDREGNYIAKGIVVDENSFKGNSAVESMMLVKLASEKMLHVRNAILDELQKYDFDFGTAEQEAQRIFERIKNLHRQRHRNYTPSPTDMKQ